MSVHRNDADSDDDDSDEDKVTYVDYGNSPSTGKYDPLLVADGERQKVPLFGSRNRRNEVSYRISMPVS